jgi:hypothetical protein
MSILERPTSPEAQAAKKRPPGDRLRVITAGDVGNIDARLGARGFDVVAVAETEDALVHAVSADEPDAIVVEADLCDSLERVRDLAPDAVLIAVGDHTPPGAVGRIEPAVSGTVMAGLLHALVADGVGAAAVWGLVPAFAQGAAVQVPQSVLGSLLSTKADLLWTYLVNAVNAFSGHAELVTAAGLAVTVSAGVVLTMSGPRTDDARPSRVLIPAVDRAPNEPAPQHPVFGLSSTTPISTPGPFGNETEPGDQREPNRGDPSDHDRHDGLGENEHNQGEDNNNHVVNEGSDDQTVNESSDDQTVNESGDDHGQNDEPHGQNDDPHGQNEGNDEHGVNQDEDKGKNEDDKADEGNDHGENDDTETEADDDDRGENESEGDQDEGNDDQGEDNDSQGEDE